MIIVEGEVYCFLVAMISVEGVYINLDTICFRMASFMVHGQVGDPLGGGHVAWGGRGREHII